MTHDDELIERVLSTLVEKTDALCDLDASPEITWLTLARAAVDAVRAYDAERRASVLDVDALKTFDPKTPGTLVWLPDGMPSIPTHDPDDYRDLP